MKKDFAKRRKKGFPKKRKKRHKNFKKGLDKVRGGCYNSTVKIKKYSAVVSRSTEKAGGKNSSTADVKMGGNKLWKTVPAAKRVPQQGYWRRF